MAAQKVLIVDDDPYILMSLEFLMKKNGYDVMIARNGTEALDLLGRQLPELVLLDIMMPEMNGYEAMQEIRKNENWQKLPVIALTAKAMTGDREKCLAAGASDCMSKPVNTEQLLSLMKVWLYQN